MATTHPYWYAFLTPLLLSAPAQAAETPPSLEARLAKLESQLTRIEERLNGTVSSEELEPTLKEFGELTKQLGWNGKSPLVFVKPGGKEQKLSIGGYLQGQAEFGDPQDSRYTGINDRFLVRRARLVLKGTFKEDFDFMVSSDFGNNSIAANTGVRAALADAFATWTKYPEANISVGQMKTPYGYEQLMADTKGPFIERSLPNDLLTMGRQIGVRLDGELFNKRLTYAAGVFNGNGTNLGNNDNDQFMYVARVAGTPWVKGDNKLTLGTNAYTSKDTGSFNGSRTGWGADAQFVFGRFETAAEYLWLDQNRRTGTDTSADGWSAHAAYTIIPKTLQGLVRYETYDSNTDTSGTTSNTWIFGLNYFVKGDDIKLSVNYALGNPDGLEDGDRLSTRLQIVF